MKKKLIILVILVSVLSLNKSESISNDNIIRFRIIANSNDVNDQKLKKKVLKELTPYIKKIEQDRNITEIRKNIINELPTFNKVVDNTIRKENSNKTFEINYGINHFPKKKYKDIVFKEGDYESLVINIGKGKGDNFWCILFPPLCFDDNNDNIEYKSLLKELIKNNF